MKKSMLALITLGCLLPLTSSPVCLKYVSGPKDLESIKIYATLQISHKSDRIKMGPYFFFNYLKKNDSYKQLASKLLQDLDLLSDEDVFITIESTNSPNHQNTIIIENKVLSNDASYEISINEQHQVQFKRTYPNCKEHLGK